MQVCLTPKPVNTLDWSENIFATSQLSTELGIMRPLDQMQGRLAVSCGDPITEEMPVSSLFRGT